MKKCIILAGMILLFAVSAFAQSRDEEEDNRVYLVVVNPEKEYLLLDNEDKLSSNWWKIVFKGPKAECLAYIEKVWTDRGPLSLRKKMEAAGLTEAQTPKPPEPVKPEPVPDTPKPTETAPDKPAPKEAVEAQTIRLFVGNLSLDTTEDSLRELFEELGEVNSVGIETDEDGNSKGTAYVEMSAEKAEEAVSTLNGKILDGKNIVVKKPE